MLKAIDQYVSKRPLSTGENGHAEYGWSNEIEDLIVQFHFQLVRTDKMGIESMKRKFNCIIETIRKSNLQQSDKNHYLTIMFKLLAQTRDQIAGKGEYALSYMMLLQWWNLNPRLAEYALIQFILGTCIHDGGHPYGSFKDAKYLCDYIYEETNDSEHPFIRFCIRLLCDKMRKEHESETPSLIWKWIPSETSKFKWLFIKIAEEYFQEYLNTAKTEMSYSKACIKARMDFRKMRAKYNARLDTVQIKQCRREWATIDHGKTTAITMSRQKSAFLYTNKKGQSRGADEDRIQCARNLKTYLDNQIKSGKEIKGSKVGMEEFTKRALDIYSDGPEKDILDSQWRDSSNQTSNLENFIAMVDSSGSMNGDPFNAGVALGIRIAEKSALGKRILCFSKDPTWLDLSPYNSFVDMVECIDHDTQSKGLSTNFYKALKVILSAIVEAKLPKETVEKMVLVILSDMQMDAGDRSWNDSLYDNIKRKYAEAGLKSIGEPYQPPHILFWNLRQTGGFPTLTKQVNASMMSGFSPSLLDVFCKKGIDALLQLTPYHILLESLNHERYKCMEVWELL
jgi:hypothetical protein